eukprot:gene8041-9889_t
MSTSTNNASTAAKKWEDAQEKAFTNWVNSLLSKIGERVENVALDFSGGVKLIHFLELLSGKKCNRKYNQDPKDKINKIQNLTIGLSFLEDDLGVKARGVGAEDFYDGNKKLIFGFLWTLYRRFRISVINEGASSADKDPSEREAEDNLLKWCSNMTGGNITHFKTGFRDGIAFLNMAKQFTDDASALDLPAGLDSIARLNAVFDFAEKNLNIPKILDAEEVFNGTVDERTVMLYTSLFYNAYELRKKTQKSDTEILKDQLMELAELEKEKISKIFRLEEELNMYREEFRLEKLERLVLEKKVQDMENKAMMDSLLRLRDGLQDHQMKLCKLQQLQMGPLWAPPDIRPDLSKSQLEQIEIFGQLLDDECRRINNIVHVSEVKAINFTKKSSSLSIIKNNEE